MDLSERELASERVYDGRLLRVRRDRVALPNGHESTREYITHPGAAVILALFDNGDLLLERQHRYPLRRDFIELPAGKFDPHETDLACAQRELLEETGYTARNWQVLPTFHPCIGYSDERLEYFVATGLTQVGAQLDADEFLEVLRVPFVEALAMVGDGRISDGKSAIGILWWAQFGSRFQD